MVWLVIWLLIKVTCVEAHYGVKRNVSAPPDIFGMEKFVTNVR